MNIIGKKGQKRKIHGNVTMCLLWIWLGMFEHDDPFKPDHVF